MPTAAFGNSQAPMIDPEPRSLSELIEGGEPFAMAVDPTPVKVTGVGFFDRVHGQNGVAPNGVELHPLLNIEFT
jgi:hypothetical protein